MLHRVPAVLLAAAVTLSGAAEAQFQVFKVEGGRVTLHFEQETMAEAGLQVVDLLESADVGDEFAEKTGEVLVGFGIEASSDLLYLVGHSGTFVPYGVLAGGVQAIGGFALSSPSTGQTADFHDFWFHSVPVDSDGPGGAPDPNYFWVSPAERNRDAAFEVRDVKIAFEPNGQPYFSDHEVPIVRVKAWDMVISPGLAASLDRPDLAGMVIGNGRIEGHSNPFDGEWSYPAGQNPWTPYGGGGATDPGGADGALFVDVKLGILSGITMLGHTGSFPNGRAGLSTSTTSCNVGTLNVPWQAQMNENHPGIAQQLYREMDGRFEQVGVAWVKHGFFALSNSQCTACQNPSPGTFLGVGCSDTYSPSNNGNRTYLGPREEWNPHDATWTADGSYFDGTPAGDGIQNQFGTGIGSVNHRLEAFDSDLDNPGATYYYEGYYLVQNDVDLNNNIGSRECTMNWNGFQWQFATPSAGAGNPLIEGPAVLRYGEMQTTAGLEPDDGNVILAVQTSDLGGGQWRYEYALFNWNLDRRVRSFTVPSCGNASDFYYHDIDDIAQTDWGVTESGGNLTWEFPDVFPAGHKVAGPLVFGTLYNFGFTSDQPPADRNAVLGIHDAGAGGNLLGVATKGPDCLNLNSSKMSPDVNEAFDINLTGGSGMAMFAVMEVGGVPLSPPLTIGPLPFVGDEATLPAIVPPIGAGLEFVMVAGEVTTNPLTLVDLSNLLTIEVQ